MHTRAEDVATALLQSIDSQHYPQTGNSMLKEAGADTKVAVVNNPATACQPSAASTLPYAPEHNEARDPGSWEGAMMQQRPTVLYPSNTTTAVSSLSASNPLVSVELPKAADPTSLQISKPLATEAVGSTTAVPTLLPAEYVELPDQSAVQEQYNRHAYGQYQLAAEEPTLVQGSQVIKAESGGAIVTFTVTTAMPAIMPSDGLTLPQQSTLQQQYSHHAQYSSQLHAQGLPLPHVIKAEPAGSPTAAPVHSSPAGLIPPQQNAWQRQHKCPAEVPAGGLAPSSVSSTEALGGPTAMPAHTPSDGLTLPQQEQYNHHDQDPSQPPSEQLAPLQVRHTEAANIPTAMPALLPAELVPQHAGSQEQGNHQSQSPKNPSSEEPSSLQVYKADAAAATTAMPPQPSPEDVTPSQQSTVQGLEQSLAGSQHVQPPDEPPAEDLASYQQQQLQELWQQWQYSYQLQEPEGYAGQLFNKRALYSGPAAGSPCQVQYYQAHADVQRAASGRKRKLQYCDEGYTHPSTAQMPVYQTQSNNMCLQEAAQLGAGAIGLGLSWHEQQLLLLQQQQLMLYSATQSSPAKWLQGVPYGYGNYDEGLSCWSEQHILNLHRTDTLEPLEQVQQQDWGGGGAAVPGQQYAARGNHFGAAATAAAVMCPSSGAMLLNGPQQLTVGIDSLPLNGDPTAAFITSPTQPVRPVVRPRNATVVTTAAADARGPTTPGNWPPTQLVVTEHDPWDVDALQLLGPDDVDWDLLAEISSCKTPVDPADRPLHTDGAAIVGKKRSKVVSSTGSGPQNNQQKKVAYGFGELAELGRGLVTCKSLDASQLPVFRFSAT